MLLAFEPPRAPSEMRALLQESLQTYGPLSSELRPHRVRSRCSSRVSPYPPKRPAKPSQQPADEGSPVPELPKVFSRPARKGVLGLKNTNASRSNVSLVSVESLKEGSAGPKLFPATSNADLRAERVRVFTKPGTKAAEEEPKTSLSRVASKEFKENASSGMLAK
jgi:hypothetical protein